MPHGYSEQRVKKEDEWAEYFKKKQIPSRGRLKAGSPTLRPGLGPGAPLKQGCSGAIEKDQRSIFINTVDLPLSPPPVHQVQQRQGSLPSHSYPSHSRVPFFSAARRTAAEAHRFLLSAASHGPCSIYQPPPSF